MTALESFPWPLPLGAHAQPRWTGQGFEIGDRGKTERLLAYDVGTSHWSDDLTSMHEAEAGHDHPIDRASRYLAVSSMQLVGGNAPIILDVGCSSGFVLDDLRQAIPHAHLIGADYLRGPLESLAHRMSSIPILQFDLRKCPLPTACVDGITCLNVLEHIDDHEKALAEIYRILKPGGIAHVEVPAGPELFDIYDEYLLHHRRYRLAELVSLAKKTGFSVRKATHLGFSVFPAFWWVKRGNRKKTHLPTKEKARLVAAQIRTTRGNPLFAAVVKTETWLGKVMPFPWGIRCVCVLTK